jgi:hypothetical protein
MSRPRVYCIGALVLLVASLLLVALDPILLPGVDHQAGNCPICSWAVGLASSVVPEAVSGIELVFGFWVSPDSPPAVVHQSASGLFQARAPPTQQAA